ncbi:MAG: GNAT family N-acetyltransferase [Anaerolineae bacterium]
MTDSSPLEVRQNAEAQRFEIDLGDGASAFVEYMIAGNNIIFTHTEVPVEFEGQGIGSRLARYVLDYARTNGYRVQALCPFISAYVERHPEYQSITWGY